MSKVKASMALALCVSAAVALGAQQNESKASAKITPLTAMDYIEIQQLVNSYPYGLDTGADHGYAWADLFAPDGSFGKTKGREALAKLAWQHLPGQGPLHTRQFVTNVIIEASPEGATGRAYMAGMEFGGGGKPGTIEIGGHYEDVYVKTPAGWKFKTRSFIGAKAGPAPTTSTASAAAPTPTQPSR